MIASALAGLAGWCATPAGGSRGLARLRTRRPRRRIDLRVTPVIGAALLVGALLVALLGLAGLGWAVSGGVAAGTLTWLWLARRRARAAKRRRADVAASARLLASLLRSGQIPAVALREAADDHPQLAEAAAASALGADVAHALERGATRPGAAGLATMAAAWRVSERSGAPVAGVLMRVAESLREEHQVAEVVDTELAAARTSGHIMAVLPFGALGLGFFAGGNPVEFLLGSVLGQWLATAAVVLTAVGVVWTGRLARP